MINKLIHADNLKNKLLYAFGTSIVYGHLAGRSFVDDLGCNYGIKFKKLAVNGATTRLTSDFNSVLDINTYCGGLENICKTLLIKYRGAKIM